jgi:8-oxo-dGTP diphosphatase
MTKKYTYDYPRASVTVDIVLVTKERKPRLLLIRRRHDPFAGRWVLPGGFIEMDETLEESARRELQEETGLLVGKLEQLRTFGDPGRDPRGRTISVVFIGRVDGKKLKPKADDDAAEVGWHRLERLPKLAFDHAEVLAFAKRWLRAATPRRSMS